MSIDLSELEGIFFEEANEHRAAMEAALLSLETRPGDRELINQVFRAAHSIKGGSGTFGFNDLLRFTHALESLLHLLREGTVSLDSTLADLLLRSTDVLGSIIDSTRRRAPPPESIEGLLAEIEHATPKPQGKTAAVPPPIPVSPALDAGPTARSLRVLFVPGPHLFRQGMDPLLVVRDVAELGQVSDVSVDLTGLPDLDVLDPETSYLGWSIALDTTQTDREIKDVFAFVEDSSRIELTALDWPETAPKAATEIAEPEGPAAPPAQISVPEAHAHAAGPGPAAEGDARGPLPVAKQAPVGERSTVRVDTAKIDKLIDLIGELVIAQSMVTAALDNSGPTGADTRLREAVLAVDRNTRELQDRVMAVRMLPIGSVFNRFPRMVRDLSGALGKKVNLVISGEEVELDKGMVEKLADPLTHLVRNAIDHGIETPDDRSAGGKPEEGTVRIMAVHQGGNVVIEVSDDGRGLALDRIREKAQKLGLLPKGIEPTVEDLHAVIFAPGFSTKEQVTDVSGRGVGMDVVKRNVEALGGALMFSSEEGKGSRMRIRLPLTMAIIDGLTLRIGDQVFVLPLVEVVESLRPTSAQYQTVLGRGEVVRVRDKAVPLVRLHEIFSVAGAETDPSRALVCIVETRTTPVGLLVDDILGQAQVVVKTLETNYHRIDGVMGATILGDGRVALILDVQAVARRAAASVSQERESLHGAAAERAA